RTRGSRTRCSARARCGSAGDPSSAGASGTSSSAPLAPTDPERPGCGSRRPESRPPSGPRTWHSVSASSPLLLGAAAPGPAAGQAAGLGERAAQQELDLAVDAPQLVGGPALE